MECLRTSKRKLRKTRADSLYEKEPEETTGSDGRGIISNTPKEPKMIVLDVPYYSQRDNYRDADRTCFSSACAMALSYLRPRIITGDDDYVREVFKRGDSIHSWIQIQVLKHFGITASFSQRENNDTMMSQINKGIPVPCGILHRGPGYHPNGGGHWICVIGYDDKGWIVHDPWGEIDHASGTYVSQNGESLHYSYNLMDYRWTVAGISDGWSIVIDDKRK